LKQIVATNNLGYIRIPGDHSEVIPSSPRIITHFDATTHILMIWKISSEQSIGQPAKRIISQLVWGFVLYVENFDSLQSDQGCLELKNQQFAVSKV
jgi:hypothetical protein